jgi:hypothetical protein
MILRKDFFLQVVSDLRDPCINTTLRYWLWRYKVGRTRCSTQSLVGSVDGTPPGPASFEVLVSSPSSSSADCGGSQ